MMLVTNIFYIKNTPLNFTLVKSNIEENFLNSLINIENFITKVAVLDSEKKAFKINPDWE